MRFSKNSTPPDFQAKDFTPLISLNFNSLSDKNTKKWVFLEKFTPLAKILHCRRHWRQWQISPLVVPFWFFWKSPSWIMQMVWPFKPLHCVNFLFTQLPHALCEFDNCLTKLSDVKKGESSCVGISLFRACLIFRILCELDNQELWWWQKCQPFRMSSQLAALC